MTTSIDFFRSSLPINCLGFSLALMRTVPLSGCSTQNVTLVKCGPQSQMQ